MHILRWVNSLQNYAKITLTSKFIGYVYQICRKIPLNSID